MRFSTEKIKINARVISNVSSDYVYLDVPNNNVYFADDTQALKINVEFSDISEDENKIYVIKKDDFLHIVQFVSELEIHGDYSYYSREDKTTIKGKFNKNENYVDILESVRIMFDKKNEYTPIFTIDGDILNAISRASIFVNPDDIKDMFRNLNIKDGYIFSSSNFRIYVNKFINDSVSSLIHADVLKFIMQLGIGTIVYNNMESYLLEKDDISMYFSTMNGVDYIPVLDENFKSRYEKIFNTNLIEFNASEFTDKLAFIEFYAKNAPNNMVHLKYIDGKFSFIVNDENSVDVECVNSDIIETDGEFDLPFDAISIHNIVAKLSDRKNFTLYASKDSSMKLFILKFSDSEIVICSKLNV